MSAQKADTKISSRFKEFAVAIVAAILALALQSYINTFLPGPYFFLTFPAAIAVAWFAGFRAALLCMGICVLGANYFFLAPIYEFGFDSPGENIALCLTTFSAVFTGWVVTTLRERVLKEEKAKTEREAHGENERLLDQIFTEAPAFMVIVSYPELVFIRANQAYERLIGRTDIVGRRVNEILPRYEADGLAALVNQVGESGKQFSGVEVPITIANADGTTRDEYFDFVYQPLLDAKGRSYAILAQGTSVTEKVYARKIIEESKLTVENERENFRNLFKQTPEMVCILSGPQHVFEFVNEAHVKVLGFDATGKAVREAQPESVEVHGILDNVYQTGKTAELHEIPVTVGKSLRYFNLTYAARRDLEGKINGVMILGTEVTSEILLRRKLEDAEQKAIRALTDADQSRKELHSFFMQAPAPMVILAGPDHRFVLANSLYEKFVGRKVVGRTIREAFTEEEAGYYVRLLDHVYRTGEPFVGRDLPINLPNEAGEIVHYRINVSMTPTRDDQGKLAGVLVFVQDVTEEYNARLSMQQHASELQAAKDEAEHANELKSAFLANMSHEIRTPLGAMIGFADLLRDPGLAPGERDNYTEILARNGESLSVIINDILDLSKVEAGQLSLEFTDVSPREVAEDVVSLLRVKAKEKDLAFDFQFEEATPQAIVSDSVRIRQILLNIVGNAIKFTQYGSVKVRCFGCKNDEGRASVCFEVTDTGIGIPLSQKDKVFEMFVQADGSMTRRFGGTGLGLALSKKLAEALGGDIVITETEPGKGSTFLITIEDQPEKRNLTVGPERPKKKVVEVKPNALKDIKILVVDDSPDNRQLIWHYLSKQGAVVETAANGLIGYRQAIAGTYDIVLMDIQMPEMDGYTATHKLRSNGFRKPIIALTAHAMTDVRQKCLNVGCTGHLPKPIDKDALITSILEYVSQ